MNAVKGDCKDIPVATVTKHKTPWKNTQNSVIVCHATGVTLLTIVACYLGGFLFKKEVGLAFFVCM